LGDEFRDFSSAKNIGNAGHKVDIDKKKEPNKEIFHKCQLSLIFGILRPNCSNYILLKERLKNK
jgi:hypothetical protein